MGNVIGSRFLPADRYVRMSNGLTDVLLGVLVLAGSDLATTPWQRRLIGWLAGKDQNVLGRGTVGFDLEQAGWTEFAFDEEKKFLRTVIAKAATGHRWAALDYTPRREWALSSLATLDALVRDLPDATVDDPVEDDWPAEEPTERCAIHRVLLSEFGCLLCNEEQ